MHIIATHPFLQFSPGGIQMAKNVSFYHFQNMNDDVLGILAQLHALTFPQFAPRGRGPSSDTLFAFELWTHSLFILAWNVHSFSMGRWRRKGESLDRKICLA